MMSSLPNNWINARLSDVTDTISVSNFKVKQRDYLDEGLIPVIDQGEGVVGGFTNNEEKIVPCELPVIIFGDHTRKFKFIERKFAAGADGIKVLKPWRNINEKFFYYICQIIQLPNKGYARHYQYLSQTQILIPPFNEQIRIVAKIEELFSRLDQGVKNLQETQFVLEQHRQAVLKNAFTGKLTKKWRQDNDLNIEDWEPTKLKKYCDLISGQHIMKNDYNFESIGESYLTGPDDFTDIHPVVSKWTTNPKVFAFINDVLITVKGAGVGKTNILRDKKAVISRQLMAIRSTKIEPKYIFYYLKRNFYGFQRLGQGSTVPGLRREHILNYPIPIPKEEERIEIIRLIENSHVRMKIIKNEITQSILKANLLKQSILKVAFSGGLVPQDPNDEPASILLEKVKAEKTKTKPKVGRGRKKN